MVRLWFSAPMNVLQFRACADFRYRTPGVSPHITETDDSPWPTNSSKTAPVTYADAGVDIDRANRTKKRIKYLAHKTFTRGVLSEIGGFGGLFAVDKQKYVDPILVSSVDGVGTKLKVAFEMNVHHTIGADLVNHCVNDIAVQGATPLFFMDYLATGKLEPEVAEKVIEGLAEACKHNGCALIGGETAEMPGFYPDGEYDLAGIHRWRGRAGAHHHRQDGRSRRRDSGPGFERPAHQRLLAGPQAAF